VDTDFYGIVARLEKKSVIRRAQTVISMINFNDFRFFFPSFTFEPPLIVGVLFMESKFDGSFLSLLSFITMATKKLFLPKFRPHLIARKEKRSAVRRKLLSENPNAFFKKLLNVSQNKRLQGFEISKKASPWIMM
jgi:hypothetical protein